MWSKTLLGVCSVLAFGCGPTPPGEGGPGETVDSGISGRPDSRGRPSEFTDARPQQTCAKMDLLFVIDNSGSMMQEQNNLIANFPGFIEVLDAFEAQNGMPIDYRVAVTSTGIDKTWTLTGSPFPSSQTGDNGAMLQRCSMTNRWIEKSDADVVGTFSCLAELGTDGPGVEMPLEAVRNAFGARMADSTNAGFHRDDALLGIVILTDEDDCSRAANNFEITPPAGFPTPEEMDRAMCADSDPAGSYKTFLDAYTGEGRWAVATIAGPGPGPCSSSFGNATEAVRLKDFTSQAGANGVFSSICDGNLSLSLQQALDTFDTACQDFPPVD